MDSLRIASSSPRLNSLVIVSASPRAIVSLRAFSALFGIMSGPGAFLLGSFLITLMTSSAVTSSEIVNLSNCSFAISLRSAAPL